MTSSGTSGNPYKPLASPGLPQAGLSVPTLPRPNAPLPSLRPASPLVFHLVVKGTPSPPQPPSLGLFPPFSLTNLPLNPLSWAAASSSALLEDSSWGSFSLSCLAWPGPVGHLPLLDRGLQADGEWCRGPVVRVSPPISPSHHAPLPSPPPDLAASAAQSLATMLASPVWLTPLKAVPQESIRHDLQQEASQKGARCHPVPQHADLMQPQD